MKKNKDNLKKVGLSKYLNSIWESFDGNKLWHFLKDLVHRAIEEIRVSGEIVLFNEDIVANLMQLLKAGPSLMGVKKLKETNLQEIFRQDLIGTKKEDGFVIKNAKGIWK